MMSIRDTGTPARHDIILAPEGLQRRYTSFYISDILAERSETKELSSEESSVPEVDSTQDGVIELSSKDHVKQEPSKQHNEHGSASTTKPSLTKQEEDNFSNLKSRSPFLAEQREVLETIFQESKYISSLKRKQLASELKLTERQIKTWFQNRRTKFRKIRGSDGLRRQDTWNAEHGGVSRVLSNIDGGINGLSKDWVLTLYKLLSKS